MRRLPVILLCIFLIAGTVSCGKTKSAEAGRKREQKFTPTTLPSQAPTPTPAMVKPTPIDASRLYDATKVEGLFEVKIPDSETYSFSYCLMKDNYLLLRGFDFKKQAQKGVELFLLNLSDPSNLHRKSIQTFDCECYLLRGGNVLTVEEGRYVTVYDNKLEMLYRLPDNPGDYLGCSEDGCIWYFRYGFLNGYQDGQKAYELYAEGADHGWQYLGQTEKGMYFYLFDENYEPVFVNVDCKTKQLSVVKDIPRRPLTANLCLYYEDPAVWYLSSPDSPKDIISFSKQETNEGVFTVNDHTMVSTKYDYNEKNGALLITTRFYDMRNGGVCRTFFSNCLDENLELYPNVYDNGYMVMLGEVRNSGTDQHQSIYLYDVRDLFAGKMAEDYKTFYSDDEDGDIQVLKEIEEQYPFHIYTGAFGLSAYSSGYRLLPCTDKKLVADFLKELQRCLADYPEGFFEDILGDGKKGINVYLCGAFIPNDPESLPNPAACVNADGDYISLVFGADYIWELYENLMHETTHMMEVRFGEYAEKNGLDYEAYWVNCLNTREYPYFLSYVNVPEGEEFFAGTVEGGWHDAWFIDAYAKSDSMEDRARTLEYTLMEGNAFYYENNPHLMQKAKFLCGLIREVFPSVKNSEDMAFWEYRTGKVDLFQEFPDFKNQSGTR